MPSFWESVRRSPPPLSPRGLVSSCERRRNAPTCVEMRACVRVCVCIYARAGARTDPETRLGQLDAFKVVQPTSLPSPPTTVALRHPSTNPLRGVGRILSGSAFLETADCRDCLH